MSAKRWLIYGANGYTGALIARAAASHADLPPPILAGRDEARILDLARELDCEGRIFPLTDPAVIARHLENVRLVLHCAGPFSATSAPMLEACLLAKAHYLDLTGEIEVFEYAYEQAELAKEAGIVVCPGVGFDVIATDCVAVALRAALPDADYLALGFDSRSRLSPGTAKTALEGLALGGRVRRAGVIDPVPLAYKVRVIDFGAGPKRAVTIPWGDIASAYRSTGIPAIETYLPASRGLTTLLNLLNPLRRFLAWTPLRHLLRRRIEQRARGPDETERARQPTYVWGEVSNARGARKTARIRLPNGYDVTVHGALAVVGRLLRQPPPGGAYTPAQVLGEGFLATLPGAGELVID